MRNEVGSEESYKTNVMYCGVSFIGTASCRSSRRNTGPRSEDEATSSSEIQKRLDEALRHIEKLENEREETLESLCKQAEKINLSKDEIVDLRSDGTGRPSSRSGNCHGSDGIAKSDSMVSIASDRCPNCIETSK